MKTLNLSVITVSFNEEENIQKIIDKFNQVSNKYKNRIDFELIICDDASSDKTCEIIMKNERNSNINLIRNYTNIGAGNSFRRAISQIKMDYALLIDSDDQYDLLEVVEKFVKIYDNRVDIYFGFRNFGKLNYVEKLGPIMTKIVYKIIFANTLNDYSCVVKVIRSSILKPLKLEASRMNYSNELTVLLLNSRNAFRDFEVGYSKRVQGLSKTKFINDGMRRMYFTIYLWIKLKLLKNDIISDLCEGKNE